MEPPVVQQMYPTNERETLKSNMKMYSEKKSLFIKKDVISFYVSQI